jgi:hypothetical protein
MSATENGEPMAEALVEQGFDWAIIFEGTVSYKEMHETLTNGVSRRNFWF